MLLLGIDIGTSSIKVSVVDGDTSKSLITVQYPETEVPIDSPQPGWAEQDPATWWKHTVAAIQLANASGSFDPMAIGAIGIAYQMHGLVVLDKNYEVLRPSIIWCDSRAVSIGAKANESLGPEFCLSHLLNSPGNFTASKLAWVKANEPEVYAEVAHAMLPGDYISFRLCGNVSSTPSSLSEGILWDFTTNDISEELLNYYGIDPSLFAATQPVFSIHGKLGDKVADELRLKAGIPVSYKAGDQPNNALSLGVLEPGEVAATAGTSGVIYAVSDLLNPDPLSRVNSFAHVNHQDGQVRTGILLCINGTGILYSWAKQQLAAGRSYSSLNDAAASVAPGSDGVLVLPFGNGAERMLGNRSTGVHFSGIDLVKHNHAHIFRAIQEGIAFAFRYGLDIMRSNGHQPSLIRAGKANLFQSEVFLQSFVAATGVPVSLYASDGSVGAAIGAGIGCGYYKDSKDAFSNQQPIRTVLPEDCPNLETPYQHWLKLLHKLLPD